MSTMMKPLKVRRGSASAKVRVWWDFHEMQFGELSLEEMNPYKDQGDSIGDLKF